MTSRLFKLRLGALPTPAEVIPTTFTDISLAAMSLFTGGAVASTFGASVGQSLAAGIITAVTVAIGRGIETAQARRGCILKQGGVLIKEPWEDAKQQTNTVRFDATLTMLYQSVYETSQINVSAEDASQYSIHVIWHDDINIRAKLGVLARRLGIQSIPGRKGEDAIPVIYVDVWRAGCSAILIQKQPDQWGNPVAFDQAALTNGKPRAFIGTAISGEPIVIDHEKEHGVLIAGASGSGKTEVFVAHHKSMLLSGIDPVIYIIDLKGTPQLKRLKSDCYISKTRDENDTVIPDIKTALNLMRGLVNELSERMECYSAADCDNIWQYRKRKNANEHPIVLYIDELAVLSRAAKLAGKDDDTAKIMDVLAELAQLGRSGGLIIVAGMQHPLAEDIPTTIRNQLMIRIVLAVADDSAAKVAGILGAQNQPMQGAMMVKHGNRIQIGRGAYITA